MTTILVVDELSANREILVRFLRDQGHRVLEASDIHEGLDAARAAHPELMICLPGRDGRAFTDVDGALLRERTRTEGHTRLLVAALSAAANAIVITDRAGIIQWVNPAFSELTGYSAAEAEGKNPGELVKSGEHPTEFYEELWQTILAGRVWRGQMINRRKDGRLYTEGQAITPVRDTEGEIAHFVAVKEDITERQRADAAFHERARLAALGAAIGLALAETETLDALRLCAETLVTHLDAAFARIWTYDERGSILELQASAGLYTHLTGSHARLTIDACKVARIARERRPHLTNELAGDPEIDDREWIRRERMVGFAGHPLMVGGRVVGVMALFARQDLSDEVIPALASIADRVALGIERHRAGDRLRSAEARMRFVLAAAGVGIWDMDFTTGVLEWSDILEAQYGLPPGTFEGTFEAFLERIHPDDRADVRETIRSHHIGGDFTLQYRTVCPDTTVRWLSGVGRVIPGADGAPSRAVGISLDVTERHKLEEQYQQAQKMEAVGRLAGGIAHDFNNLLTAILGYCDLLLDSVGPDDPRRGDVLEIEQAGTRAAALTRQLLAFSRKQIIEPTLLDLSAVARDMRKMLGRLIGEDVKIVLRLPSGLPPVKADRGQVEQIIMNLALNARDAMPSGGTLTIKADTAERDAHHAAGHLDATPGRHVVLTVTDTGTGMTLEVLARLFEPFFTTKEVGKGTGLGLATVHGIVTRSGGTVEVESELGKGTSVRVYFLAAAGEVVAPDTPLPAARRPPATETVLVVEDSDGLRRLAKRLLEREGYTVFAAGNAEDAVRLFEQHPSIDLVLTDVVMPGASGPELARRLLEWRPAIKIIYMSGYTEEAIVHHGILNPGIAFLHKPFTSDALARKLRDVLSR